MISVWQHIYAPTPPDQSCYVILCQVVSRYLGNGSVKSVNNGQAAAQQRCPELGGGE